jgi:DNA invertase Pin-like site-specific DNA recombinase
MKMTKEKESKNNSNTNWEEVTTMKAVGYVSGVYVDYDGNVVDREGQKKLIRKFASENGIEVTAIFEDMDECEKVLDRPGVKKMIADAEADIVLVDRVWAIGRTRASVTPFMRALDSKGMRLEAATDCFDVTSQFTRFWYRQPGKAAYAIAKQVRSIETKTTVEA